MSSGAKIYLHMVRVMKRVQIWKEIIDSNSYSVFSFLGNTFFYGLSPFFNTVRLRLKITEQENEAGRQVFETEPNYKWLCSITLYIL